MKKQLKDLQDLLDIGAITIEEFELKKAELSAKENQKNEGDKVTAQVSHTRDIKNEPESDGVSVIKVKKKGSSTILIILGMVLLFSLGAMFIFKDALIAQFQNEHTPPVQPVTEVIESEPESELEQASTDISTKNEALLEVNCAGKIYTGITLDRLIPYIYNDIKEAGRHTPGAGLINDNLFKWDVARSNVNEFNGYTTNWKKSGEFLLLCENNQFYTIKNSISGERQPLLAKIDYSGECGDNNEVINGELLLVTTSTIRIDINFTLSDNSGLIDDWNVCDRASISDFMNSVRSNVTWGDTIENQIGPDWGQSQSAVVAGYYSLANINASVEYGHGITHSATWDEISFNFEIRSNKYGPMYDGTAFSKTSSLDEGQLFGVLNGDRINLRREPSLESEIIDSKTSRTVPNVITQLPKGAQLQIIDSVELELEVVEHALLKREMAIKPKGSELIRLQPGKVVKIKDDSGDYLSCIVEVKNNANPIVLKVNRKDLVFVTSEKWYHIRFEDQEGYLYSKFIKLLNNEQSKINRDPDDRKDVANVYWKKQYTLFHYCPIKPFTDRKKSFSG